MEMYKIRIQERLRIENIKYVNTNYDNNLKFENFWETKKNSQEIKLDNRTAR